MAAPELEKDLLAALQIYHQVYGLPTAPEQLQGVAATLLRLALANQPPIPGLQEPTQVINQVLQLWNAGAIVPTILHQGQQLLATQAHQWQANLSQQVTDILSAYIQHYAPGLDRHGIQETILTALPLITQNGITSQEVNGLVGKVLDSFDWQTALASQINPGVIDVVKHLVTACSQKPLENAVSQTVTAYIQKFAPGIEKIGENLIEQTLSAVLKQPVDFDLNLDLNLVNHQLLIQQVSFKLNIMKQSPPPSKTALAMAAQLQGEITKLQQEHQHSLAPEPITQGVVSADGLTISSPWTSPGGPG
ncbi:MAG: hypothetical protein KGQ93_05450 [Cyanobacteria bacterium REEB459]|nr:hypothetical protein [Cyanobacteria bacterium REEB459]